MCGQHSLEIFCLGVFLSFAAHFLFTEVSNSLLTQIIVSLAGIVIMVAIAALVSWYRRSGTTRTGAASACDKAGLRGGRRMMGRVVLSLALLALAGPAWAEHRPNVAWRVICSNAILRCRKSLAR